MASLTESLPEQAEYFLAAHPELDSFELLIADMNGVFRGKRVNVEKLLKVCRDGLFLPASVFGMDINGETMEETGLGIASGDSDRHCKGIPGTLKPVPWQLGLGQMMFRMEDSSGTPFFGNPREVLLGLVNRLEEMGFWMKTAIELEFFLIQAERTSGKTPELPEVLALEASEGQLYSLNSLEICSNFFRDINKNCKAMDVPANTSVSELAPGQFEVNLHHVPDPVMACEHALLLKKIVRGSARCNGMNATFMAKPFVALPGSGMHVHLSLYGEKGTNLFAGKEKGSLSPELSQAIAGILDLIPESMIYCAPHANSYHRFTENSYAPVNTSWGKDNRTTTLRIPASSPNSTRIEHRFAGADANPYLVMAVLLAGILHGLEQHPELPPETKGNAYLAKDNGLPESWESSLRLFEIEGRLASLLGSDFSRLYANLKRGEQKRFRSVLVSHEYDWYLNNV